MDALHPSKIIFRSTLAPNNNKYAPMSKQSFLFYAQDGYPLSADFYPHQGSKKPHPILIAPATGIIKGFYRHFAHYLSTLGYDVISFDFRGIGESLHGDLHNSNASILDWGQSDLPAAVDCLLAHTQAEKIILVGHSTGGQLLGVMPNFQRVAKLVAIAGSSGHLRSLKGRTKLLAPVMFFAIFPLGTLLKGYAPTKMIGMVENLPQHVGRDWAKFCRHPSYIMNAKSQLTFDHHQHVNCPITAIYASDDEIATRRNVQDLLRLYPKAPSNLIELKPKQYQHRHIGHMLMFKSSHQNLWLAHHYRYFNTLKK